MARTLITAQSIGSVGADGFNLTDATYTTMSTGSGNGVYFAYDSSTIIVLRNDSGGAADYTVILGATAGITGVGGTVTDPVADVATGKIHIIKPATVFKQTGDYIYIDCDVAGKILVLSV